MSQESAKKNSKRKVIFTISFVGAAIFVGLFAIPLYNHLNPIKPSEIPVSLFSQGYDLICTARNSMELCLYHETPRTNTTESVKLALEDTKNNTTKLVDLFQINSVNSHYCIKEFHTDLKNQTQVFKCNKGIGFDKNLWTVYINTTSDFIQLRNDNQW